MAEMTPEQTALASQAKAVTDAIAEIEASIEEKHREKVEIMKAMRDKEMSWAAIGRIFGVTPQAAMYATGASVRTPKPRRRGASSSEE